MEGQHEFKLEHVVSQSKSHEMGTVERAVPISCRRGFSFECCPNAIRLGLQISARVPPRCSAWHPGCYRYGRATQIARGPGWGLLCGPFRPSGEDRSRHAFHKGAHRVFRSVPGLRSPSWCPMTGAPLEASSPSSLIASVKMLCAYVNKSIPFPTHCCGDSHCIRVS